MKKPRAQTGELVVDWSRVVITLMRNLMLTQKEFAETCQVAQQTVSAWKDGIRHPGRRAQRHLVLLAMGSDMTAELFPAKVLSMWRIGDGATKYATGAGLDDPVMHELSMLIASCPEELRREILAYARFRAMKR